jgi:PAS domain S-box-containing protein
VFPLFQLVLKTSQNLTISEQDTLRCLLQGSQDGILVSGIDRRILQSNAAVGKLIGVSEFELIGQPLSSVVDVDSLERSSKERESAQDVSIDTTDGGTNGDGRCASARTTIGRALPPARTVFCRTGVDLIMPVDDFAITNSRGDTVGFVTIVYIVQASSVQQAQTEFVSTVSHELRTPLTSIKGFADTILRAGDRIEVSQQRRYLGIIKDQADRLTRLVEDLLAVSRLESKKMQLTMRAIDFSETLQRVIRNLSDKARHHRIVCHLAAGLPPVWADADRLEQILTNLIDNAIKYSPQQTTVTIEARDIDTNPEMVEFSVSDEGVGIPSEHIPQIFTKFSRLDNPLVRQTEGTGLGLYITRSLVSAMGGQIRVESFPGKTTFTVRLPATSLEEQAARGRD